MSDYQAVPVMRAKELAVEFNKSHVVILCYDRKHNLFHTTTYGAEGRDKVEAARLGEVVTVAAGADMSKVHPFNEDFRREFDAALYTEAVEMIKEFSGRGDVALYCQGKISSFLARLPAKPL